MQQKRTHLFAALTRFFFFFFCFVLYCFVLFFLLHHSSRVKITFHVIISIYPTPQSVDRGARSKSSNKSLSFLVNE